jgi:HD superfamily phosphohydrolase
MQPHATDGQKQPKKPHLIYDVLYGFVRLTPLEWRIIHSPFYQRLKWIKQLGFSFYTFPGAEHSRFGHSIGVMYNAHCILQSIGKAVPDEYLFSGNHLHHEETNFHQSLRLAALLHDIGTFPFSHTTEMSYIKYGELHNTRGGQKNQPDDHEHLGSFIMKRTRYEGGLTHILEESGIDPQKISNLIKGIDPRVIANQILHSEVDCDRMDYLLRDAHYTGLNYGAYDRDYLMHHFKCVQVGDQEVLAIHEKAIYCIQDFLMSRFAWYSQVIRSARGAKFDALAEEICYQLLEQDDCYSYKNLLEMVETDAKKFFAFNDQYFINLIHKMYHSGEAKPSSKLYDMIEHLLFAKSPKTIKLEIFKQRILNQDDESANNKIVKQARDRLLEMSHYLDKHGSKKDWILDDLPRKNVVLVKSQKMVVKEKSSLNILHERDPAKILMSNGNVVFLSEYENSMINKFQNYANFVPNVFCSESAYEKLEAAGFFKE